MADWLLAVVASNHHAFVIQANTNMFVEKPQVFQINLISNMVHPF